MNNEFSAIPAASRYFEDYTVGMVSKFGHVVVKQSDIVDFALRFDPQPFHTDLEAAKRSPYGGVIASGWHTSAMMMRLLVEHYLSPVASLGSPGVDELRWTRPVRPGDVLSVRVTVTDSKRSKSKPDRGLVHLYIEVLNQRSEAVMSMKAMVFMLCRPVQQLS
jgi:acyl dehydratase